MQVLNTQPICNCVCYKCVTSLTYLSMKSFLNIFLLSLLVCLEISDSVKLIKLLERYQGLRANISQSMLGSDVIGVCLHLKSVVSYSELMNFTMSYIQIKMLYCKLSDIKLCFCDWNFTQIILQVFLCRNQYGLFCIVKHVMLQDCQNLPLFFYFVLLLLGFLSVHVAFSVLKTWYRNCYCSV